MGMFTLAVQAASRHSTSKLLGLRVVAVVRKTAFPLSTDSLVASNGRALVVAAVDLLGDGDFPMLAELH
jgi:hypothetical protein